MTRRLFGLVGCGGFGREVMPYVLENFGGGASRAEGMEICFVESTPSAKTVNGVPVCSLAEFMAMEGYEQKLFNIAIAASVARERLANELMAGGCIPQSIVARSVLNLCGNTVAPGAIICGNSMITSNSTIGRFFHGNMYSYVAHDCRVGDFVTFAPRVSVNGYVVIDDHAYIGTGVVIKQGTRDDPLVIGSGATVGMGAVVTKSVAPGLTVLGNPARPMEKP